jgi:peptide/nickel transport system permease protein
MFRYILRRLFWAGIVVIGLITITFVVLYVVPSDPARAVAGGQASPQAIANIRHQLGLDQSLPAQFRHYLGDILHGDLGYSYTSRTDVVTLVRSRIDATLLLAFSGVAISLALGLALGLVAALKPGGIIDAAVLALASIGVSTPPFWLGLVLLYYVSARLGWLPIGGYGHTSNLILPALTLGLTGASWYARVFRTSILEVLAAEYIRAARGRGLPPRTILLWHVVPNAITPVVTLLGLDLAYYMGGVAVVETVFGWPGIGLLAWQAIGTHDLPVILGVVLVSAIAVVLINVVIDVLYSIIDPRIRYT